MSEEIKYEWDGEQIKQMIDVPDKNITPMEMLSYIDKLNAEINQMEQQEEQHKNAVKNVKKALLKSKETLKQWKELEPECERLQFEKLQMLYNAVKEECMKKAVEDTEKEIAANPADMTKENIANSKYVKFRASVTQHEKIRNKVCKRIITKHLYEEPFFENPFEEGSE